MKKVAIIGVIPAMLLFTCFNRLLAQEKLITLSIQLDDNAPPVYVAKDSNALKILINNKTNKPATLQFAGAGQPEFIVEANKITEFNYKKNEGDSYIIIENSISFAYSPARGFYPKLHWIKDNSNSIPIEDERSLPAKKDDPSSYLFIPGADIELEHRMAALEELLDCCTGIPPKKVDYEIVYNRQEGCRCYFEQGINIRDYDNAKKRFRPQEGKDLYFRTLSYHPYRDSLGITVAFKNRNEEFGERFLTALMQGQPDFPKTEIPKADDNAGAQSGASNEKAKRDEKVIQMLTAFRNEMDTFYRKKRTDKTLSLAVLEQDIAYIQKQVKAQFGGQDVSPKTVLAQGNLLIDGLSVNSDIRTKTRKILHEGVDRYERVLTYNTQVFQEPINIQNADITEIKFQWYKDGKPTQGSMVTFFNQGGFKIDFSAGLVLHALVDQQFTTILATVIDSTVQGTPPVATYDTLTKARVIRKNSSLFSVDAGVFAHFYTRNKGARRINYSGSIGAVPTKRNDVLRMRYAAGFSVLFGSEQRLVLTLGAIGGNVSRLAERLEAGDKGSLLDIPSGQAVEVPTRDIFQAHSFLAVTFNFATISPK